MKRKSRQRLALALAAFGIPVIVPVQAEDVGSLKRQLEVLQEKIGQIEQSQARQEQARRELETKVEEKTSAANIITKGDSRGSFRLPGLDTSLTIGGYVKGDVIISSRSAGGQNSIGDQFLLPSTIPVGPNAGDSEDKQTTLTARQSRAFIRTATPTPFGALTTLIEGDFYGASLAGGTGIPNSAGDELVSGRNALSLRHAYATLGNLGAGQFWTAFENPAALPETLDFGGPVGEIFIRQPQVRWTQPFPGGSWEFSLESPEAAIASGATLLRPDDDRYPDIVGRVNLLKTAYGDFWGGVLVRNIRIDQTIADDDEWGLAGQVGGIVPVGTGKDDFRFQLQFGEVVGRYQELGFFPDGILINGEVELSDVISGFAAYRHWWTPEWRSTLALSAAYADHPSGAAGLVNQESQSAHLNLIWSPVPRVNLGVEYIYARREVENGLSGNLNRGQFSAQYTF